jgi:hypothetical protein
VERENETDNPPLPDPDTAFRPPRLGPLRAQPMVRKRFKARKAIHQTVFLIQAPLAPFGWILQYLISLLQHVRRTYPQLESRLEAVFRFRLKPGLQRTPPGNLSRHYNRLGKERTLPGPVRSSAAFCTSIHVPVGTGKYRQPESWKFFIQCPRRIRGII